ncbi:MAG: HDIG domain-containing metalloprotein [Atribacterota bacterium]
MSSKVPTREEAYQLLTEYNKSDSLIKHALTVEGVMRYFARKRGEDEEKWGVIGLVHDLDYEQFPEEHCHKSEEILKERGWPEEYIRAVVSHGWGLCSEVEPQTELEKVLYAVDELTGLVVTTALVRPSKSVMDVKVKSVKKKWKDKRFAAGVDRSIIEKGAQILGMEITDIIADTLAGMQEVAEEIGLKGV